MNEKKCTVDGCTDKHRARMLCSKHYQQAWKAGTLEQHPVQPRTAGRHACPPDHKHALTGTCYAIHRCRCDDCTDAATAREARRRRQRAYGTYNNGLVDAAHVRAHIETLQASGIGWKRIADLTGVGRTAISQLIYGRKGSNTDPRKGEVLKRVGREKAEKILALRPSFDLLLDGQSVPALGTHRRIQALVCNGWSLAKIGARLGITPPNLSTLLRRDQVLKRTHDATAALYDELWDVLAPTQTWHDKTSATRAMQFAKQRRWLPPLAWDNPDTDIEPPAVPDGDDLVDEVAVELALIGEHPRLTPAERREAVRRLHRERWSDARIAEQIGCTDRTVFRIREGLGLEAFDQNDLRDKGAA